MISDQYGRTKSSTQVSLVSIQSQELGVLLRKEQAYGGDEPVHCKG